MHKEILLVDDDSKFFAKTAPILNEYGFDIKYFENGEAAVSKIKKNYSLFNLVLVDLDMPQMNGIEVIQNIRKFNKNIPIVIVSAFLNEPKWEDQLENLDETFYRLNKPFPIITSKDFATYIKVLKDFQNDYDEIMKAPFKYSLDEFMQKTETEQDEIFNCANKINSEFVNYYFQDNQDIDWIIIAKNPGNIIDSGSFSDEPTAERLNELSREFDGPVFTYSRPIMIEEIKSGWSRINDSDFYPTVFFKFNEEKIFKCHFDTGSPKSFINYNKLIVNNIIERTFYMPISTSDLWGGTYEYYNFKLETMLYDYVNEKKININVRLVKKWESSPLTRHYNDRDALIGRNLLTECKIAFKLCGISKQTLILE